jgi:hypothetical protein
MNVPEIDFDSDVPKMRVANRISVRILRVSRTTQVASESLSCLSSTQSKELDFYSDPSGAAVGIGQGVETSSIWIGC